MPCWDFLVLRWLLGTPAVTWTTELEWNLGKLEFLYQLSQLKCATLLMVFELMLDPKSKEKKNPKLLSKNMLICEQASAFNKI